MSTTLTVSQNEMRQLEPQKNLVESTPVKESRKLSEETGRPEAFQEMTWEDLRGLSFLDEEDYC